MQDSRPLLTAWSSGPGLNHIKFDPSTLLKLATVCLRLRRPARRNAAKPTLVGARPLLLFPLTRLAKRRVVWR